MTLDHLADHCRALAEAYVVAAAVRGREQAIGTSHEATARRVEDAAFGRFLDATARLSHHDRRMAKDIERGALLDAMHAAADSLRDALNAQRSVA